MFTLHIYCCRCRRRRRCEVRLSFCFGVGAEEMTRAHCVMSHMTNVFVLRVKRVTHEPSVFCQI